MGDYSDCDFRASCGTIRGGAWEAVLLEQPPLWTLADRRSGAGARRGRTHLVATASSPRLMPPKQVPTPRCNGPLDTSASTPPAARPPVTCYACAAAPPRDVTTSASPPSPRSRESFASNLGDSWWVALARPRGARGVRVPETSTQGPLGNFRGPDLRPRRVPFESGLTFKAEGGTWRLGSSLTGWGRGSSHSYELRGWEGPY